MPRRVLLPYVDNAELPSVNSGIRRQKLRMIESIEGLNPEFEPRSFAKGGKIERLRNANAGGRDPLRPHTTGESRNVTDSLGWHSVVRSTRYNGGIGEVGTTRTRR